MAAGLIIIPNFMPAYDINGDPVVGAKLWFYLDGTTTETVVYSDYGLTVEAPNPLVADSSGVFDIVYADEALLFTVAITDFDGVPLAAPYEGVAPSTSFAGSGAGGNGFTSVNPATIKRDGATDVANALQAELNRIAALGGGTLKLIGPLGIRLNKLVTLDSNITLDVSECPLSFGSHANLKISGNIKQVPTAGRPYLYADALEGATTLDIVVHGANVTPAARQRGVLRGPHTEFGAVIDEFDFIIVSATMIGAVTGGVRWTIVIKDPLDADFLVDYPSSDYAPNNPEAPGHDYSTFAVNVFSPLSANAAAGATMVTVEDGGLFTVDDYVYLNSTENCGDATGKPTDHNIIRQEMNRIVRIVGDDIYLARAISHAYNTTWFDGLTVFLPVENTHIVGARITYFEDGLRKTNSLSMKRAVDCSFRDCHAKAVWTGPVWYSALGNTFRDESGLRNRMTNCTVVQRGGAADVNSGSALTYGIVIQGATDWSVLNCQTENCRHGVLVQAGASGGKLTNHTDINSRISGIDFHGLGARKNSVSDCRITAGPSNTIDANQKAGLRVGNSAHWFGDYDNVFDGIVIEGFGNLPLHDSNGLAVTGQGISLVTISAGNLFRNIVIDGADYGVYAKYTAADDQFNQAPYGNTFENVTVRNSTYTWLIDGWATHNVWPELNFRDCVSDGNTHHFEGALNTVVLRLERCSVVNPVGWTGSYILDENKIILSPSGDDDVSMFNAAFTLAYATGRAIDLGAVNAYSINDDLNVTSAISMYGHDSSITQQTVRKNGFLIRGDGSLFDKVDLRYGPTKTNYGNPPLGGFYARGFIVLANDVTIQDCKSTNFVAGVPFQGDTPYGDTPGTTTKTTMVITAPHGAVVAAAILAGDDTLLRITGTDADGDSISNSNGAPVQLSKILSYDAGTHTITYTYWKYNLPATNAGYQLWVGEKSGLRVFRHQTYNEDFCVVGTRMSDAIVETIIGEVIPQTQASNVRPHIVYWAGDNDYRGSRNVSVTDVRITGNPTASACKFRNIDGLSVEKIVCKAARAIVDIESCRNVSFGHLESFLANTTLTSGCYGVNLLDINNLEGGSVFIQVDPTYADTFTDGVNLNGRDLQNSNMRPVGLDFQSNNYSFTEIGIADFAWSGGTVTASTDTPHGWPTGAVMPAYIDDVESAGYGGKKTITIVDSQTFTYPNVATLSNYPSIALASLEWKSFTIASFAWSAGTVTVTTSSAHGKTGTFTWSVSGATNSGYNDVHTVTVASATTLTYARSTSIANEPSTSAVATFVLATSVAPHGLTGTSTHTISRATNDDYNGTFDLYVPSVGGTTTFHYMRTASIPTESSTSAVVSGTKAVVRWADGHYGACSNVHINSVQLRDDSAMTSRYVVLFEGVTRCRDSTVGIAIGHRESAVGSSYLVRMTNADNVTVHSTQWTGETAPLLAFNDNAYNCRIGYNPDFMSPVFITTGTGCQFFRIGGSTIFDTVVDNIPPSSARNTTYYVSDGENGAGGMYVCDGSDRWIPLSAPGSRALFNSNFTHNPIAESRLYTHNSSFSADRNLTLKKSWVNAAGATIKASDGYTVEVSRIGSSGAKNLRVYQDDGSTLLQNVADGQYASFWWDDTNAIWKLKFII